MARDEAGADRIRVIVGDDHPLMLDAIVGRLATDPSIEVVGTATNGAELVELHRQHQPDVVLSDYRMPNLSGVEIIRAILETDPGSKVLIFSAYDDPSFVAAGLAEGAAGYVLKTAEGPELVAAVHAVARGDQAVAPAVMNRLIEGIRAPKGGPGWDRANPLTKREQEVLTLVSQGLTNAQIAEQLFVSPQTIKTHLVRVYEKLEVNQRAAAVRRAMERGYLSQSSAHRPQ